jgi:HK97 family phage major capsid protein
MTYSSENKAFSTDAQSAVADLHQAFEALKDSNDQRLGELETRLSSDVLLDEKIARIDQSLMEAKNRLDKMSLEARRPALEGAGSATHPERKAFEAYVRAGENLPTDRKNLNTGTSSLGGAVVPEQIEAEIIRRLANISPIRAIASVQQSSTGLYKRAFSTAAATTGWVAETAARPVTTGLNLAELSFPAMELYAMPAATQALLDDGVVNIEQWLADEVETAFAEQESAAFVNGNGTTQPRGFLNQTIVANSAWTWGNIGAINTGAAGAFAATNPSDSLVDLIYALKGGYRQNAQFVMNRRTQSAIRRFKDAQGNYLWQPPASIDQPASLMGFAITEAEAMPDIAANSLSIAFGDFKRGYLIVDRTGLSILRDPYSNKPYVLFYVTKRVGGGVQDFDAIKVMRFAV